MSKILSANIIQNVIYVPEVNGISGLSYQTESPSVLFKQDGKKMKASCLNCYNPMCMKVNKDKIDCSTFPGMSHDMTMDICPVNAIKQNSYQISIDERKCFGCGLCVSRCPIGALYLKNNKAVLNTNNEFPRKELQPSIEARKEQKEEISKLSEIAHTGNMVMENETSMDIIYQKIKSLPQEQQNLLARNILICLSNNATISRKGDVCLRMDGYYENGEKHGVVEVETGLDMLEVSRAILDDIAVLSARHNIPKEENSALAICLNLANRRTDYWQEIKDIRDITRIEISTVTFAILLIFMWNGLVVNDFSDFYIDVDDSSLRSKVERMLERKIRISTGHAGMIENSK